ncbi:helix-turn-helix transcriptional regulator [Niallia sp. 01092]|uniref:helix-turn-helix transcriptional regulator n=1 Tax=unclassified Niallia TaxID=2837522 RepID=UPI003FD51553
MYRKKLREVRKKNGYTYQKMADKLGITKSYYWQIENGKRGLSYDQAVKIASIFQKTPDEIFLPEKEVNNP